MDDALRARMEGIAARPNTTVLTPSYESTHAPWSAERLRGVVRTLRERVASFPDDAHDFHVRKQCLEDCDILAFQRRHPKLYYVLTDRTLSGDARYRRIIDDLVEVRARVERGELADGATASAAATDAVVQSLLEPRS